MNDNENIELTFDFGNDIVEKISIDKKTLKQHEEMANKLKIHFNEYMQWLIFSFIKEADEE